MSRERAPISLPLREVSAFPVRFWVTLPAPSTLVLALGGLKGHLVLTTSRERHRAAPGRGEAAYGPKETLALLAAAEASVAGPEKALEWSERKLRRPDWVLTSQVALEGLKRPQEPLMGEVWWDGTEAIPGHWISEGRTMGWLAAHYSAELVEVVVESAGARAPGRAA